MAKVGTPLSNARTTIPVTGMALAKAATSMRPRTREDMAVGAPRTIRTVATPTARIHSAILAAMVETRAPTRAVKTYLVSATHTENLREKANMDPNVLTTTLIVIGTTAGPNISRTFKAKLQALMGSQIAMERK
jgi:hypothetical protein